jgi:hypothetical protein
MRSVWAILGAFLITSFLFRAADFTMLHLFPSKFDDQGVAHDMGVLIFVLCYAVAFYVLGGFLAAAFAPRAKLKHALVYGVLVLAIGVAATTPRFDAAPKWFYIANLASAVPAAALGGRLRGSR